MVLYSAKNLTARSQARELLALAAGETWGLSPLPRIARQEGGKPFFPEQEGRHFNLSAAWPCAPWTTPRWGLISRS